MIALTRSPTPLASLLSVLQAPAAPGAPGPRAVSGCTTRAKIPELVGLGHHSPFPLLPAALTLNPALDHEAVRALLAHEGHPEGVLALAAEAAAFRGDSDLVALIASFGPISVSDRFVLAAVKGGNVEAAGRLIRMQPVRTEAVTRSRRTVLAEAIFNQRGSKERTLDVVRRLVTPGLPREWLLDRDQHGRNILEFVLRETLEGLADTVRHLLPAMEAVGFAPLGPEDVTPQGWNALFHASVRLRGTWEEDADVIRYLVERGWPIGAVDRRGATALHYAVVIGAPVPIATLLSYEEGRRVALEARDGYGRTPIEIAALLSPDLFTLNVMCQALMSSARPSSPATPPQCLPGFPLRQPVREAEALMTPEEEDASARRAGWRLSASSFATLTEDPKVALSMLDHCDIDIRDARTLTLEDFTRDYLSLFRPIVLRNAISGWKAWEHWTRANFTARYGHTRLPAGLVPYASVYGLNESYHRTRPVKEFLEQSMVGPEPGSHAELLKAQPWILFSEDLSSQSRKFLEDFSLPRHFGAMCREYNFPQISLGSLGSGSPFHSHAPAFNGLIFGRKSWFLVRTGPTTQLEVNGNKPILSWLQGGADAAYGTSLPGSKSIPGYWVRESADPITRAKLKGQRALLECTQRPGDLMYVPPFHSHATLNGGDTLATATELCRYDYKESPLLHLFYGELTAEQLKEASSKSDPVFPFPKVIHRTSN